MGYTVYVCEHVCVCVFQEGKVIPAGSSRTYYRPSYQIWVAVIKTWNVNRWEDEIKNFSLSLLDVAWNLSVSFCQQPYLSSVEKEGIIISISSLFSSFLWPAQTDLQEIFTVKKCFHFLVFLLDRDTHAVWKAHGSLITDTRGILALFLLSNYRRRDVKVRRARHSSPRGGSQEETTHWP